ncbi:acyl-CoA carboxylase subunit epsilon [Arthrobacter sp. ZGTC131]|uniref:acyl-CoA carboxylase subunit epsilon n=1 Tax=Arthrobacter sp. ZGTC131 TaxID=2058898 RepID=UPI000CE3DF9C|nr:acyl-CoA carboxylase subunit epsilon [Arthrobacter sp. ZGTC131]
MSPATDPAGTPPAEPAETAEPAEAPLFSVVKGEPTPEELAALTAVVLSLGSAEEAELQKPSVRHWVRRQQLRLGPTPGPGSWKRSRG